MQMMALLPADIQTCHEEPKRERTDSFCVSSPTVYCLPTGLLCPACCQYPKKGWILLVSSALLFQGFCTPHLAMASDQVLFCRLILQAAVYNMLDIPRKGLAVFSQLGFVHTVFYVFS